MVEEQQSPTLLAGRYRLGAVIGTGGMSTVHRAHDVQLGRDVAVKILRAGTGQDIDRTRAEQEVRLLARVNHPGLVALYDATITADPSEGPSFLVTELVRGYSLGRHLQQGPFPLDAVRWIGQRLAAALAAVHQSGIVHRDVKPGNVLVEGDPRQAGSTVKLTDFGIALTGGTTRRTEVGTIIGTAAYLSPEQVLGLPITGAADVYSLGLLLLELATGRQAYPGNPVESAIARLNAPVPIDSSLDPALTDLIRRMTAKDADGRPSIEAVESKLRAMEFTSAAASSVGAPTERIVDPLPLAETRAMRAAVPVGAAAGVAAADDGAAPVFVRRRFAVSGRKGLAVVAGAVVVAGLTIGAALAPHHGSAPSSSPSSSVATPSVSPSPSPSPTHSPSPTGSASPSPSPSAVPVPATVGATTDPAIVQTTTAPSTVATSSGAGAGTGAVVRPPAAVPNPAAKPGPVQQVHPPKHVPPGKAKHGK
ncbi:serine/threonine-protein kinase [Curtobacterium sp. ISL-83]|uniref:serine/threonine-protein kinase n=1 Tax=Curtobacterium sp. ISL-83 TaxID=2819145 RepID=UPI001BE853BA|nr:serine/threonine-protein kinase [Curtobacterium sp. ISL-83]MBT2502320.1 serine/threonine protein kinase [Curtobacterium sp. ISL-83]